MFVFNQCYTNIFIAMLTKTYARSNSNISHFNQQLGKFKRAQRAETFWNRNPSEHGCRWWRHIPACAAKTVDEHIATLLIDVTDISNVRTVAIECCGCCNLNWRESTIIEIGFNARQCCNQTLIANRKAHTPTRHRECLRHRGELDRNIYSTRHFKNRWRRIVIVEIDFRIGQIRKNDQIILTREIDYILVEIKGRDIGSRVRREVQDQRKRLWNGMLYRTIKRTDELFIRLCRDRANNTTRHEEAERMNWIGWIRAKYDIAGRSDRLRHIGEAFLGAKRSHNLRIRVELHAETARIILCLRTTKTGNTL